MKKLIVLIVILAACSKESKINDPVPVLPVLPVLTTATVDSITFTSAVCGGRITSDGGSSISARGVCWNIAPIPTIQNAKIVNGKDTGSFTSRMYTLRGNTTYYVRAWATNSAGTGYGNSVVFKTATNLSTMVLIPAGTFRMGNITKNSLGKDDEMPVHEVTITHAFYMSRTEVTQGQWKLVMGINPGITQNDSLPVYQVSWLDAVHYCNYLSNKEGLDNCFTGGGVNVQCDFTKNGYRLPTEAEWEYACRAGTETDHYTDTLNSNGDAALNFAGWYRDNSNRYPQKVGKKLPNNFGLYDMLGNMYEFCWDWYSSTTYTADHVYDPRGAPSGTDRVLRGGCYLYGSSLCRASARWASPPDYSNWDIVGVRLVRNQ